MHIRKLLPTSALLLAFNLHAEEWTKSWQTGPDADVSLRAADANVAVRGWDLPRVEARVITKGYEIKAGDIEIVESQTGARVMLEVRMPRESKWNHMGRDHWVRVDILVPRKSRMEVRTGDGNIQATGLEGDTRLNTGDGNIAAESLTGRLEAMTGDGNVRATGRFAELRVTTGDGNVEVRADAGSQAGAGWRINSGDGNVALTVPADFAADLDARTGDGKITVDVPLQLTSGKPGGNQARGKLNGGGGVLTVRTGDGSIHIGRG